MRRFLYWTPRVLSILMTIFISLFALDVFGEGYSFWLTLWALLMHIIPTFILVFATVVAWKRDFGGGIIFIILGLLYALLMSRQPFIPYSTYIIMSGPLFLIGGLFLLNGFLKRS